MTLPLCRLCPKPAHFNFREGILLCAECAAEIFKLCEISSSCGGVEGHAESGQGTRKGSNVKPFDSATLNSEVGIKPGPQDFIISPVTQNQNQNPPQSLQVTEHDGMDHLEATGSRPLEIVTDHRRLP